MTNRKTAGWLTGALVVAGIYAAIQALLTMQIVGAEELSLTCTRTLPKSELSIAAWGGVLAFLVAFGAGVARVWRLAACALLVEAGFVVAWVLIGGFAAFDCVLDV